MWGLLLYEGKSMNFNNLGFFNFLFGFFLISDLASAKFSEKIELTPDEWGSRIQYVSEFMHNGGKYSFVTSHFRSDPIHVYGFSDEEHQQIHGEFFSKLPGDIDFNQITELKYAAKLDVSDDACMVTSSLVKSNIKVCSLNVWFDAKHPVDDNFINEAKTILRKINSSRHPTGGLDFIAAVGIGVSSAGIIILGYWQSHNIIPFLTKMGTYSKTLFCQQCKNRGYRRVSSNSDPIPDLREPPPYEGHSIGYNSDKP